MPQSPVGAGSPSNCSPEHALPHSNTSKPVLRLAHGTTKVEDDAGLVANDLVAVSGRYRSDIAWPNLHLCPVSQGNVGPAREHVHEVVDLAEIGAN